MKLWSLVTKVWSFWWINWFIWFSVQIWNFLELLCSESIDDCWFKSMRLLFFLHIRFELVFNLRLVIIWWFPFLLVWSVFVSNHVNSCTHDYCSIETWVIYNYTSKLVLLIWSVCRQTFYKQKMTMIYFIALFLIFVIEMLLTHSVFACKLSMLVCEICWSV